MQTKSILTTTASAALEKEVEEEDLKAIEPEDPEKAKAALEEAIERETKSEN